MLNNRSRKKIGVTPLCKTAGADISNERQRVYTYPGGHRIIIDEPKTLWVKPPLPGGVGGGSHRVLTKSGHGIYITYGWLSIEWSVHDGKLAIEF
jgi:hypothetical protein